MSTLDFTIVQGNDRDLIITVLDPDTLTAIDLTGVTAISVGFFGQFDDTAVFTKTLISGVEITDDASGEITVTITDTDTATMAGKYRIDGQVTDAAGKIFNIRNQSYDYIMMEVKESLI